MKRSLCRFRVVYMKMKMAYLAGHLCLFCESTVLCDPLPFPFVYGCIIEPSNENYVIFF